MASGLLVRLLLYLAADAVVVMLLLLLQFAGLGATELAQQQQLEQRDAFARLHASMSLACVPASLPCRQEERSRLQGFVRRALHEGEHVVTGSRLSYMRMYAVCMMNACARTVGSALRLALSKKTSMLGKL
jgi:hypothetical protein